MPMKAAAAVALAAGLAVLAYPLLTSMWAGMVLIVLVQSFPVR